MKKIFFAIVFCLIVCTINGFAQTEADREAIKRTALNYAEEIVGKRFISVGF